MKATCAPEEGNKVRLTVEVEESEVDAVLKEAVRSISRQIRVPGFRPGKVPQQVLEARMGGAAALRLEALRDAIPDLYAQAVRDTEVDPIAPPEIDVTAGEESGPFAFDAVVAVRPIVSIPGYAGLSVTIPSPEVTDEEINSQLDRLRDTDAELVDVDRPAVDGDRVTIDLRRHHDGGESNEGLEDFSYELGSGTLVPGLDDQLRGCKPGDVLVIPAGGEAGAPAQPLGADGEDRTGFRVLVKAVREKLLPPLTDEWAAESSEFTTLAELRQDLLEKLNRAKVAQARLLLQERAVGALADLVVDDEVPTVLVEDEVRQRVHDLVHRLQEQGIGFERFLELTGRTADDLVAEVRVDAFRAVKIDLALRALADQESIEVSEDELDNEIAETASRMDLKASALRRQLEESGRLAAVRSEQRKAKALEWLLEHVEAVDEDGVEVPRNVLRGDETNPEGENTDDTSGDRSLASSEGDAQ